MLPLTQLIAWQLAGLGLEKLKEEYLAKFRPRIKDTHPNLTKVLDNSFWVADALMTVDAIRGLLHFKQAWKAAGELWKLGKQMRKEKGVRNKIKGMWNQFLSVLHRGGLVLQGPATLHMAYGTVREIREVPYYEKISEELQKEEALREVARQIQKQMEEMGLTGVRIDQIVNSEIMKNFYKLLEKNAEMDRALDLMLDNEELEELIYQLEDLRNSEENLYAQYLAEDLADYIMEQMETQTAYSQAVQILASMLAQGGR
jgi:ribosomal protein L31E